MRGLWKLTWIEWKLFLREPMGAFFTVFFPLVMLVCFGTVFGNKPNDFFGGYGMVDISVPAYASLVICMSGFFLLTTRMATYREQGILRRMRPTPLRPHTLLAAQVIALFAMTGLGMAVLFLTAKFAYGMRFDGNPVSVTAALVLSTLSFFALGFVVAAVAPTSRSALTAVMIVFYPMIFLSGATMPREQLPETVRRVAQVFPLTHVVNLLRGLWIGEHWGAHWMEAGILVGLLVAGVIVSTRIFRWE